MVLRRLAAVALGLLVTAYVIAVVFGRIPRDARLDFAAIVLVLIAAAAIVLLFSPRSSLIARETLTRLRSLQIANLKVDLDELRAQQADQTSQLELIGLLLPLVLSDDERRHLVNLHRGTTAEYVGGHGVRSELRRLRHLALITNSRPVGSAIDGSTFDLKDLVQLTELGTKWAQQIEELENPPAED
jgi:hypothetical protein